jgi:predicted PurR-regulated permease PerM
MRWIPAIVLALVLLTALIIGGQIILVPLLCSVALAYLLAPVVSWFENRGWSRSSSALLTLTTATLTFILILIFILPGMWGQLTISYYKAKELVGNKENQEKVRERIKQISPKFEEFINKQIERWTGDDPSDPGQGDVSSDSIERILTLAGSWLQRGLFRLVDLTATILDLLLIPFFVFYLLADYQAVVRRIDRLIPPRHRQTATGLFGQINQVLSSYVRGQLLIALIMGVLYSLGFALVRVPLALTLGMLTGLLNFVPYLGTLTGFGLSILFVALDGGGIGRLGGVLLVFALVQSLEGYYLTPKFLGRQLNLHPLWVLIGLVIGGNLFGLLGIILAVPLIAIAKVFLGFLEEIYCASNFYCNPGIPPTQGNPAEPPPSTTTSPTIIFDPHPQASRRSIITASELKSRIRDPKPPADE